MHPERGFDYLSKLLHWRQDNEVIARGGMKHYVLQKGSTSTSASWVMTKYWFS